MLSKNERRRMWGKQGGLCFYCHEPLQDAGDNPTTVDHVIPHSLIRGIGDYIPSNFVLACKRCNQSKGDKIPQNWNRRIGNWRLTDFGHWVWAGNEVESEIEL